MGVGKHDRKCCPAGHEPGHWEQGVQELVRPCGGEMSTMCGDIANHRGWGAWNKLDEDQAPRLHNSFRTASAWASWPAGPAKTRVLSGPIFGSGAPRGVCCRLWFFKMAMVSSGRDD